MLELVVLSGSRAGIRFGITDVPIVVGRSPEANVRIGDPWISNMHALIEARGGEYWVVDLGSRNGTFVDAVAVTEARVAPGTALAFGQTRLVLRASTDASALTAEPLRTPIRSNPVSVTVPQKLRPRPYPGVTDTSGLLPAAGAPEGGRGK